MKLLKLEEFNKFKKKYEQKLKEGLDDWSDKLSLNFMGKIFTQMRKDGWDGSLDTADEYFDAVIAKLQASNDKDFKADVEAERESVEVDNAKADSAKKGLYPAEDTKLTEAPEEVEDDTIVNPPEIEAEKEETVVSAEEPEEDDRVSGKSVLDLLLDRVDETITVGEFNALLQSIFSKYNEVFLLSSELYNQDPDEIQEVIVFDDDDMYTINYVIKDLENSEIAITDANVE